MDQTLGGCPRVLSWAANNVLKVDAQQSCNWGRIMRMGGLSERIPFLAPQRTESAFADALLLKCSLSDKGLTPAALRDFGRLIQESGSLSMMSHLGAEHPDWLHVLRPSAPKPTLLGEKRQNVAVGDKPETPQCDVTLARGLKSAMPKSGMGWRIVS